LASEAAAGDGVDAPAETAGEDEVEAPEVDEVPMDPPVEDGADAPEMADAGKATGPVDAPEPVEAALGPVEFAPVVTAPKEADAPMPKVARAPIRFQQNAPSCSDCSAMPREMSAMA